MDNREWEAEKYGLSKTTIAFLPERMPVKDAEGGELGYTSAKDGIYIAREHETFSMLSNDEQRFFRKGVFAHELLHQIFTDFYNHKKMIKSLEPYERDVFALIANVLEDPAIEYWAKTKMGGSLLRSLKFMIAHIYKQSPDVSESETAFSQLVNALIQFGDMGLVKGQFTFPEAQEIFIRIAPLFNDGILEPNGKRRLEIAKEIMDITRPLWEEDAKQQEEFRAMIEELMKAAGKEEMSGSGHGEEGDSDLLPDEEEKTERRKKTMSKMKSSEESDDENKESGKPSKSSAENSADSESEGKTKGEDENSEEKHSSTSSSSKDGGEGKGSSLSKNSDGSSEKEESTESSDSDECDEESISKDMELTEEDIAEMMEEIKKAERELEKEKEAEKRDTSDLESIDLSAIGVVIPSKDVLNRRALPSNDATEYNSIVNSMATGIANASRQLQKMLTFANEDTEYSTRGKINVRRLNCGKSTARVFDKKRIPNKVADLVVGIAVDLSGSMSGPRITNARKCCIALAEICHNIGVPVYIMGYTGEIYKHKVVHEHYVTWNNTKQDRMSLLNIDALAQNYDGPSFRYFTEIMKKKPSNHKLLIVISDGEPCASDYYGSLANKDTAMAIRDARRVCDVLGVALGNSSTEILQSFYGNDFLHVSQPSDLFAGISIKLKKFVRKWMEEEF